jgi:hypothetical protein
MKSEKRNLYQENRRNKEISNQKGEHSVGRMETLK